MSCPTRPGPKSYVDFIHTSTGHRVTADDWHMIKDIAAEEGVEGAHSRKHVDTDTALEAGASLIAAVNPVPDFELMRNEYNYLTKRLEEINDIENPDDAQNLAASTTRSRIRTLKRQLATIDAEREELRKRVKSNSHTEGNIVVINYLAQMGVRETLSRVRGDAGLNRQRLADMTASEGLTEPEKEVIFANMFAMDRRAAGHAFIGGYCYCVTDPSPTGERTVYVLDAWGDVAHETTVDESDDSVDAFRKALATDDEYGAARVLNAFGLTEADVITNH